MSDIKNCSSSRTPSPVPGLFAAMLGLVPLCLAGPATGSGFAVDDQNALTLGTAQAGQAAIASDATTVHHNPAGMIRLPDTQGVLSGVYIMPSARFENDGSSLGGAPLSGGNGGEAGVDTFVPTLYLSTSPRDGLKLGLAVTTPFGLGSDYDSDWIGRYHTIESDLMTININPAVAVRVSETVSVGGGVNFQYLDAELTNAVDFGSLLGFPQAVDGRAELTGDNWAVGYNLGLLYEPSDRLRFGLAYRSRVHHDVEVDADFDVPAAASPLQAAGLFNNTGGRTEITLPESVSLSAYYDVTPRWALLADVTWTRWSRFEELAVQFDNPMQPAIVEPQEWNDSFRVSAGARFAPSENWVFRAGIAYDETPIPDEFQRPRLVVGDRVLVAVGAGYRFSDRVTIDAGYMHSFSEDVSVDISNPNAGRLVGDYDLDADLLALQVSVRF